MSASSCFFFNDTATTEIYTLSLHDALPISGVSNPYLSQVERGLRKPSAEILASIARGLKIAAETLYEQAGVLDRRAGDPDTVGAIRADDAAAERRKAGLRERYENYVREPRAPTAAPSAT